MKPRVHWVSPLPPARTDIAHYTTRILRALAEAVDLVLWTDKPDWDPALNKICLVYQLDPDRVTARDFAQSRPETSAPEVVIVQMGNAWEFHAGLMRLARRVPCIVVFHDVAIQEMLGDAMDCDLFPVAEYMQDMAHWYGPEGQANAERVRAGKISPNELGQTMPGFEFWLPKAQAGIVHTPAAHAALSARTACPIYQLALPFLPSETTHDAVRAPTGPLRLMQFGYIGPNRRIDTVLDVLADLKSDLRFRFDIAGTLWQPDHIRNRIETLGLTEHVHLHGFVAEPALDARLRQAHLVFNLRHPTMGEASGSQLRIWNAATAAVVTDQGWYSHVPDDTVFKIPVEDEAAHLRALLLRLDKDRALGAAKGQAGRAYFLTHHTPADYARHIAAIAEQGLAQNATTLPHRSAL